MSGDDVHVSLLLHLHHVRSDDWLQQMPAVAVVHSGQRAAVGKDDGRHATSSGGLLELQQALKPGANPASLGQQGLGVDGVLGHVEEPFVQHVVTTLRKLAEQLGLACTVAALQRHDDERAGHRER